jgi:hypothetical protein
MGTRKLRVESVDVTVAQSDPNKSLVKILFSRKLTALEVSGVKAVLEGQVK